MAPAEAVKHRGAWVSARRRQGLREGAQSSAGLQLPSWAQAPGMCRREVRRGGPGAGRSSLAAGGQCTVTHEGALGSKLITQRAVSPVGDPGSLSSPLPVCWVNIVIPLCCPPGTAWPCALPRVTGPGGDRGMERSPTAWKMTQDLWAASSVAESQGPGAASSPPSLLVHRDAGRQLQCAGAGPQQVRSSMAPEQDLWTPPIQTEGSTKA